MNIVVGKAIKELLFDHDTVILPGLGGFTATSVAATVDYVQGTVQPPAKKLEFNTNLVTNDGTLINHIQQAEVITAKEANEVIASYVDEVKESLENREIVDIPNVGRLYKDFEQKIRFMPEGTNFKVESFGLPTVQFNPIARQKTNPSATAATPTVKLTVLKGAKSYTKLSTKKLSTKKEPHWAEKALPWLIVLAAILLAISLFMWLNDDDQKSQAVVPQERVNVKPAQEEEAALSEMQNEETLGGNEGTNTDDSSDQPPTEDNKIEDTTTKPITEVPAVKPSTFIVIHSFGENNNAQNFSRTLKRGGYTPVTKFHNQLYRVGVEIPSAIQSEIDQMVNELGKKYKSTPVPVDY